MALRLYNTLTRQIEPLDPIQAPKISMYVCGMTPSFHPHLGHARTFITFDVLYRYLKAKGYDYRFVFTRATRHCDSKVFEQTLADTLVWMWQGYPN